MLNSTEWQKIEGWWKEDDEKKALLGSAMVDTKNQNIIFCEKFGEAPSRLITFDAYHPLTKPMTTRRSAMSYKSLTPHKG
jgi:hypothetical protein